MCGDDYGNRVYNDIDYPEDSRLDTNEQPKVLTIRRLKKYQPGWEWKRVRSRHGSYYKGSCEDVMVVVRKELGCWVVTLYRRHRSGEMFPYSSTRYDDWDGTLWV